MSQSERKIFQNVDPQVIAKALNSELKINGNNQPLFLYIYTPSQDKDSVPIALGHISFNSPVRNPEDFSVRSASFLRKYGTADDGTFRNNDFILQNGLTIVRKGMVHILLDSTENTYEDLPENTWVTLSKKGIEIGSAATPDELPAFFKGK